MHVFAFDTDVWPPDKSLSAGKLGHVQCESRSMDKAGMPAEKAVCDIYVYVIASNEYMCPHSLLIKASD